MESNVDRGRHIVQSKGTLIGKDIEQIQTVIYCKNMIQILTVVHSNSLVFCVLHFQVSCTPEKDQINLY
jgi:hypothetical protein